MMNASLSVDSDSYEPQQSSTQAIIWSLTQTAAVYFTAVLQIIKSGFVNNKECCCFSPEGTEHLYCTPDGTTWFKWK